VWALAGDSGLRLSIRSRLLSALVLELGERESPRAPEELERGLTGKSRLQELGRGNFCHGHWLSSLIPDSASGQFYFKG